MKLQITSLIFLFFLGIAFGEQHCIDDSFGSSIIVKNDYSGVEYYKVSSAVSSGAVLSLSESLGDGFFLMPGEQKLISYNISLPFKGNYSSSFKIIDSKGKTETKSFNYEVADCHNVDIKIISENDNYCLRQNMPYKVIVNNNGKYKENLFLMINNDPFSVSLLPGTFKEYDMEFYSVSLENNQVIVSIKNGNLSKTVTESFNLRNCDTTAVILEDVKSCPGQTITSSIILKNLGFSQDAYQIINSSSNIIIEPQIFVLESNEEKIIEFDLMPSCGEIGLRSGEINIISHNSGLIKSKINYEALNCFEFEIIEANNFMDYCENDNKNITISIKNKGLLADSYTGLLIYGNQKMNLNFYLEPKEIMVFNISEYFNYSGDAKAELIIKSNNYCEKTKTLSETFNVNPFDKCYSGKLEVQEYFNGYSRVKVTNIGLRQNEYFLTVFNNSQISNMSFSLNSTQSKEYQLNNLNEIMNDYGISVFSVNILGKGVDLTKQTRYSNSITGMIILSVKEYYSYAGLVILIILISLFVKNNVLKLKGSNNKL
ncbi:MAG: hypothetical protein PHN56_03720 [Candidatus Nanoarchaeia archaeon]|nr:hypothetical protein [Candidatus Nanoarchaeia archaeon]